MLARGSAVACSEGRKGGVGASAIERWWKRRERLGWAGAMMVVVGQEGLLLGKGGGRRRRCAAAHVPRGGGRSKAPASGPVDRSGTIQAPRGSGRRRNPTAVHTCIPPVSGFHFPRGRDGAIFHVSCDQRLSPTLLGRHPSADTRRAHDAACACLRMGRTSPETAGRAGHRSAERPRRLSSSSRKPSIACMVADLPLFLPCRQSTKANSVASIFLAFRFR